MAKAGEFFLYIYHDTVSVGDSAYKWYPRQFTDKTDADNAAKLEITSGATSVQIFQLLGTATRDIVIK
jgi:hypothetical protein